MLKKTIDIPVTHSPDVFHIPLSQIDVPENRARSFDPAEAVGLAAIIEAHGLHHPIRVRPTGNRLTLVSGRKRLAAAHLLGWKTIPVTTSGAVTDDEAKLEEVLENLGSFDLDALDRCHHLYELKQVHERLYPTATHGGDRKSEIKRQSLPLDPDAAGQGEVFGFSTFVAEKIGLSDRAIRLAVKIWTDLTADSRIRACGTRIAKRQSALKELSEQTGDDQAKVLDMVLADPPVASTVADAVEMLKNGIAKTPAEKKAEAARKVLKSLPQPVASSIASAQSDAARLAELQKGIATLSKFFGNLKDDELDTVIQEHEDRIIASLKRRGRI